MSDGLVYFLMCMAPVLALVGVIVVTSGPRIADWLLEGNDADLIVVVVLLITAVVLYVAWALIDPGYTGAL